MSDIRRGSPPDRRRYFRIDDEIVLVYRPVPSHEVPEPEQLSERFSEPFSLTSTLACLTHESRSQLRRIQRDSPQVAEYLEVLERKIDVLAQAVMMAENPLVEQPTRQVNLSASGIAFDIERGLSEGEVLELKMVVPPALVGILTFGKVVYCRQRKNGDYRVGVDFLSIRDQDREFLVRHVVKRQLVRLREKQPSPGSESV
ncbi:PilZ domain-containing protein [Methylohalobius crimeensis]|uniref:PilZ domain-containing protein n=1 Tax=Methylohalobius crimeensis TaxID=244365 RepID=UPI0003B3E066|nr:PilZ domain-containing protein [Methylohalobius crimeensis]